MCVRRVWRLLTPTIYDQEAEARRARRHTITSTPASGPRCHICGRICVSEMNSGSGVVFVLTVRHSTASSSFIDGPQQASKQPVSDSVSSQSSSTDIAACRFYAPTVWNSLPSLVRTAGSFTSFMSQLKTYMFARHL